MKNEKKFKELIDSLKNYRNLFFSGSLHNEKEFIEIVHKIQNYIPLVEDQHEKEYMTNFVNSIKKHKNYDIALRTIKQAEIRQKEYQEYEKERLRKIKEEKLARLQKGKELSDVVSNIKSSLENKNLNKVIELYEKYYSDLQTFKYDYFSFLRMNIQIIKCLNRRKIRKLIHFTNIENLESILNYGLLPRKILEDRNISFKFTDADRHDHRKDCTSLSIEYPNFKMLYLKKKQYNDNFIVIVLDAISILLNEYKKYYLYINAANKNAQYWLQKEELADPKYFDKMFMESVIDIKRDCNIPDYITTDPQAEILYNGPISIKDILEIHFNDTESYNNFLKNNYNKPILNNIRFINSNFYFKENLENIEWEIR